MSRFGRQLERQPRERRVVLQRPAEVDDFGSRRPVPQGGTAAHVEAWARDRVHGRRFRTHPIVRLTETGIDWGAEPRPGDEVGYCTDPYRGDTCFQAAIATVTQVPVEQVPDLELDRQLKRGADPAELNRSAWERILRWATERGLEMVFHDQVPVARRRWIGVVVVERRPDEKPFDDHCLVMADDRLVFDPMCSVKPPPGMRVRTFDPSEITYGLSFDQEEDRDGSARNN